MGSEKKVHLFKIKCLTDMHVGDGEANYSLIDNEVQKDTVLTDVPIIHASGVKGALRQFFIDHEGNGENQLSTEDTNEIFGTSGEKETKDSTETKAKNSEGAYKFFSANLLARPLRVSDGDKSYVLATSEGILENFITLFNNLKGQNSQNFKPDFSKFEVLKTQKTEINVAEVEGKSVGEVQNCNDLTKDFLKKLKNQFLVEDFVIVKNFEDYPLPVRARNYLDKENPNLWYEEDVPHESVFYFFVIDDGNEVMFDKFVETFGDSLVQFGGNATVGNGYTKVEEIDL